MKQLNVEGHLTTEVVKSQYPGWLDVIIELNLEVDDQDTTFMVKFEGLDFTLNYGVGGISNKTWKGYRKTFQLAMTSQAGKLVEVYMQANLHKDRRKFFVKQFYLPEVE